MTNRIALEILTDILPEVAPELEAVHDGTQVGFFRFVSGPYKGIVYTYVNAKMVEVDGRLEVKFTHIIMQDPDGVQPKNEAEEKEFNETIGWLLVKIIDASNTVAHERNQQDVE